MELERDWREIRRIFGRAQRSALHSAFATTSPDGTPHVSPIGSLWLVRDEPRGYYLDVYNMQLARNLDAARSLEGASAEGDLQEGDLEEGAVQEGGRVTILAVDARYSMWLRALLVGRFPTWPGVRLTGVAGPRRKPSAEEFRQLQKQFKPFAWTRGYNLLWKRIERVREIAFDGVQPVKIGPMTKHLHGAK